MHNPIIISIHINDTYICIIISLTITDKSQFDKRMF
jgi:hypothetical protein